MSDSMNEISTSQKPALSKGLKSAMVLKIIKRLRPFLENDEHLIGVYKPKGLIHQAVVVTNYRIIGVKLAESRGNVVFADEVVGKDMESVLLQAKKNVFGRIVYDVIIDTNGKKNKYTTVKSDDADSLLNSLEKVKSKDSFASVLNAQKRQLDAEKADRSQIKSLKKEIGSLERNSELLELQNLISSKGLIASFNNLSLYFNRIEQSGGRVINFTDKIEIVSIIEGSVYTTQETIGGSKKRDKVQTKNVTHDDRKIKIEVNGSGGYLSDTVPFSQEAAVNDFISKSKNTNYDYQQQEKKLTDDKYMSQLYKKVEQVKVKIGLTDKYRQLANLENKLS